MLTTGILAWCGQDVFTCSSSSVVKPRTTGGDPAERHPPGSGHPRTDEDPGGCGRSGLGQSETPEQVPSGLLSHGKASERVFVCPGVGHHPPDVRVHQPHGSTRGAGTLAGVHVRAAAAAASSDHLRHQPETPGRKNALVVVSRLSALRPPQTSASRRVF